MNQQLKCMISVGLLGLSLEGCSLKANRGSLLPVEFGMGAVEFRRSLKPYDNCEELQSDWHDALELKRLNLLLANSQSTPEATTAVAMANSSEGDVTTNLQESGVDEADFVKVATDQIVVYSKHKLRVVNRQNLERIGEISLDEKYEFELFIVPQKDRELLVAVGNQPVSFCGVGWGESSATVVASSVVSVFVLNQGKLPTLIKTFEYLGAIKNTRVLGERLVMVINQALPLVETSQSRSASQHGQELDIPTLNQPIAVTDNAVMGVACTQVYQPAINDADLRFTQVAVKDLSDLEADDFKVGFAGGNDYLYMTEKALVLTRAVNQSPDQSAIPGEGGANRDFTAITQVDIGEGGRSLRDVHYGLVQGRIKDQWALKEVQIEDQIFLAVATTTGYLGGVGEYQAENHLFALIQDESGGLKVLSQVDGFGRNEDIRSIRYVGNFAYVVTFEKTDPVFAIDLSNPARVQVVGELKVPGFSTYLQPAQTGKMMGVGFDAHEMTGFAWFQGIQLSLFDISSPLKMDRIDNVVLGDRGSFSEATSNHHAYYFDRENDLVALPIVELVRSHENAAPYEYGDRLAFVGAKVFAVKDKITLQAALSHQDLLPLGCAKTTSMSGHWWQDQGHSPDIRRILKVDGELLTVSDFAIRRQSSEDLSVSRFATTLMTEKGECP